MPGDELSRIREYEKLGNKYLAAGDRALKQLQIANAPMMKYLDAVDCWDNAGKCFNIAGEFEDSSHAYSKAADCLVNRLLIRSLLTQPASLTHSLSHSLAHCCCLLAWLAGWLADRLTDERTDDYD
jgi:tetratricopeptide (TPR) repeat protein